MPRQLKNVEKLQDLLKTKPESYWIRRGQRRALILFQEMSKRVPAYRDFLKRNNVNPEDIRTIRDFHKIPTIDKDNYLRKYPLESLCWDGDFSSQSWVFSATSGSTGEPFYFPRTDYQDKYYALTAELYLRENFQIHKRSTLYIDAFAMGAWIGGLFTYEAVKQVAEKGYELSIITPGINKAEVINDIKKLGPKFDQILIGCYPPIMKDILDLGAEEGINWRDYNLGLVFSAEGFGEEFRDHIINKAGLNSQYFSTLNHYGTVDLGTMSHETALSILVRKQALNNNTLWKGMFGHVRKQPTLTQFIPEMFYFESEESRIICSSFSGLPLVRYDLKDTGGVLKLSEITSIYKKNGIDLKKEAETAGVGGSIWNLPFVYLYERSDMSVTLVGGNIYPEEIRKVLLGKGIHEYVTGKFTMEVVQDKNMDSKLVIHVELKKGTRQNRTIANKIQKSTINSLLEENSEYVSNYASYGKKLWPQIQLWPYEHPLYFSGRGKQKWVKK